MTLPAYRRYPRGRAFYEAAARDCPFPDAATAQRLYPDNRSLQAEWLRAVDVVRSTARGWLLDSKVTKR